MKNAPATSRRHALKLLSGIPLLPMAGTLSASSLLLTACGGSDDVVMKKRQLQLHVRPRPGQPSRNGHNHVGSTMTVNFSNDSKVEFKLAYQPFFDR